MAEQQATALPDSFDPTTLAGAVAQCVADRLDPTPRGQVDNRVAVACKRIADHYGDGDWVDAEDALWEREFAPMIDRVSEGAAAHGSDALADAAKVLADEDAGNDDVRDALIALVAQLEDGGKAKPATDDPHEVDHSWADDGTGHCQTCGVEGTPAGESR